MNNDQIMIWLSLTPGLGARKIAALKDNFYNITDIWDASRDDLLQIPGISAAIAGEMIKLRNADMIYSYEDKLRKKNISYAALYSEAYPALLSLIQDPPAVIYYKGELPDTQQTVAVIGSRRCSEYGVGVARRLARDLAMAGLVIVSGMAKGIDSWAHIGALKGGGKTIAVLGSGVDICYPAQNRQLYEQIIASGCVLSEYPPGTEPHPTNFPARNRIISGLSKAVVVVEAAMKSGTLITVDMALEQGREVLAVPGNVTSQLSSGTNALIKQGAHALVTDYTDVLNAIGQGSLAEQKTNSTGGQEINNSIINSLAPLEKLIYDCVDFTPKSAELIAHTVKIPVNEAVNICTMLEIQGLIKKLPGMRYAKE